MPSHRILFQHTPSGTFVPPFGPDGFLFNTHQHLTHQHDQGFYLLTAVNQTSRQADARCAFFIQAGKALSPIAAPFGSIEFTESLPDPVLDAFIQSLLQAAHSAGAATLRMVNYPTCYAPLQADRLTQKLGQYGFQLVATHSTSFLPVTDTPFANNLVPAERRRLAKCIRAGFQFRQCPYPDSAAFITFLQDSRHQHGYSLSISSERLKTLLANFGSQCTVFSVWDGATIAAMTLTIRVRHDILYNFQPASGAAYQSFSPMVLLMDGVYTYCQQQEIKLFDLGLSLDNDHQHKPSLMRFKRNLGAQESSKLIFEKDLMTS